MVLVLSQGRRAVPGRLESSIQRSVVKYAKERHGVICIKLSSLGRFGTSGWPDYVMFGGVGHRTTLTIFMEFKAEGKQQTPLQKAKADELIKLGFDVYVIDDVAIGRAVLDRLFV